MKYDLIFELQNNKKTNSFNYGFNSKCITITFSSHFFYLKKIKTQKNIRKEGNEIYFMLGSIQFLYSKKRHKNYIEIFYNFE